MERGGFKRIMDMCMSHSFWQEVLHGCLVPPPPSLSLSISLSLSVSLSLSLSISLSLLWWWNAMCQL